MYETGVSCLCSGKRGKRNDGRSKESQQTQRQRRGREVKRWKLLETHSRLLVVWLMCRYCVSSVEAYQSGSWKRLHVAVMADMCVDIHKHTQCSRGLRFPQREECRNLTAMCVLLSPNFRLQNKLKQAPQKFSKQTPIECHSNQM